MFKDNVTQIQGGHVEIFGTKMVQKTANDVNVRSKSISNRYLMHMSTARNIHFHASPLKSVITQGSVSIQPFTAAVSLQTFTDVIDFCRGVHSDK